MRPREWTKNLLVFSGVMFSRSLTDVNSLRTSLLGFALFCCASSGVYLFNDLCDLKEDREHPIKQNRPLASGQLNSNLARVAMIVLFDVTVIGSIQHNYSFAFIIGTYDWLCLD